MLTFPSPCQVLGAPYAVSSAGFLPLRFWPSSRAHKLFLTWRFTYSEPEDPVQSTWQGGRILSWIIQRPVCRCTSREAAGEVVRLEKGD